MDKNAIKKFAVWARNELINRVMQKALAFGIQEGRIAPAESVLVDDKPMTAIQRTQRAALVQQIEQKGYQHVMDDVAYTWFNRFIALRFMEVNGYLPSRVRVFTDENGKFNPQIIDEAIHLDLDGLDMEKVYAYKEANQTGALYRYLLTTQCNALSKLLPRMFQPIQDYTELLLPDNLLREGSVIEQMVTLIPEEDWQDQVQIIGWLYQYYNTEPKDKVFADLKRNIKISKEKIPAATQLFTPDWIVRYMVENSLGRLWLEGHPNETLKAGWKYYLDEAEQEPAVQEQLAKIRAGYAAIKPEDIRVIDPCMGSGHILVYMFDVLVQIYEDYGYTTREAVESIIQHNLYGLDIDDRAAQLAYFAVMMKARQYDRRFLSRKDEDGTPNIPQPHVYAIVESNGIDRNVIKQLGAGMPGIEYNSAVTQMNALLDALHDAKEYGSILTVDELDWALLRRFVAAGARNAQLSMDTLGLDEAMDRLPGLINVGEALGQKYDVAITNPPYRGIDDVESKLQEYVQHVYPNTSSDLSTVFMEATVNMLHNNGYVSMINIPVWMSLGCYKELRKTVVEDWRVVNMLHLGRGMFGSDFGTTAFVISKTAMQQYKGLYKKFFKKQSAVESEEAKQRKFFGGTKDYVTKQQLYTQLPNHLIAYWATESYVEVFATGKGINQYATVFEGLKTRDKDRFLRLWFEISSKKWKPYSKGGAFRRWYGNHDYVVNWGDDGAEVRAFKKSSGANFSYYFTPTITYTAMTMSKFTGRYIDKHIFGGGGGGITAVSDVLYLLGLVNSMPFDYIISAMKSTVNFEVGQIGRIPVIEADKQTSERIRELVQLNVDTSRSEWDSFEYSWDFQQHPLVRWIDTPDATSLGAAMMHFYGYHPEVSCRLELAWLLWQGECEERFKKLKANEEELNRIFIDIYGLQDELTPDVDEKDVTVRRADLGRDIRSLISYAVGVMFGRYSLDVPGLAYAGGAWDASKYTTIIPDKDGILPICDDEYFEDDIVGRFVRFIEVVYGKDTLEQNLAFIARTLGGKGTPREVIRSYFLNDFYKDHLRIYQKRPIYWLFDSGKKNGFKCLIYMHRYAPDTIARIRTDYVHEQQSRYRTALATLERQIAGASGSERVRLTKQQQKLQAQAEEIRLYEEKIHHLADQMIAIDLDDGVKHNYEIFRAVLAPIK